MYPSQTALATLIIPYLAGAIGIIILLGAMVMPLESFGRADFFDPIHDFLCIIGTYMTGFGMLIFRLFRGVETKRVKYAHLIIHTLALLVFLIFGTYRESHANIDALIDSTDRPPVVIEGDSDSYAEGTGDGHHPLIAHAAAGWVALVGLIMEGFRRYIAPFHDIFGLWVFICLAACCFTGLHECKVDSPDFCVQNYRRYIFVGFFSFCITYSVCLNPYFEWELVGKL